MVETHDYRPEINGHFKKRDLAGKNLTLHSHIERVIPPNITGIKSKVRVEQINLRPLVRQSSFHKAYNLAKFNGVGEIDWKSISKPDAHERGIFEVAPKKPRMEKHLSHIFNSPKKIDTSIHSNGKWIKLIRPISKLNRILFDS